MAGHSKWSKVKRIQGALDVIRGRLFPKLSKETAVAARLGEATGCPRLRRAMHYVFFDLDPWAASLVKLSA